MVLMRNQTRGSVPNPTHQLMRRRSAASFERIPSMAAIVCTAHAREGLVLDRGGGGGGGGEGGRGR